MRILPIWIKGCILIILKTSEITFATEAISLSDEIIVLSKRPAKIKNIYEITKESDNKLHKILDTMTKCDAEAIKRITTIVQSLKKFIRLDEAKKQLTDVDKEMDLTLILCQHLTKNRITIEKNYTQLKPIYTHPNMLNQVFMNLITNAAQSIDGKGKITISINIKDANTTTNNILSGQFIKSNISLPDSIKTCIC